MNGLYTIILLILSNVFMTFAWYGHLRLQQSGISGNWPLLGVIAFSWGIAFFEYCCQVPANRLGFIDNGGPPSSPTSCFRATTFIGTTSSRSFSSSAPCIWCS